MKLYIADNGWSGAEIIFANSEEEALEIAKANGMYFPNMYFQEFEIAVGFVTSTTGDC